VSPRSAHKTLSIVVPIKNEALILEANLADLQQRCSELSSSERIQIEVVLADCGSTDLSLEIARSFCDDPSWHFVSQEIPFASVGKTVHLGLQASSGLYVLILPADCRFAKEALPRFLSMVSQSKLDWGGFRKAYEPSSLFLKVYVWLLNRIRSQLLRNLVWTNGIFVRRKILEDEGIPLSGFLEDLDLSDRLKRKYRFRFFQPIIFVSSRRYTKSPFRHAVINATVIALHRLGFKDRLRLRSLYEYGD